MNEDNEEQVACVQLFCKLCPFVANRSHTNITTVNIFQHDLFFYMCLFIVKSAEILLQGQNGDC